MPEFFTVLAPDDARNTWWQSLPIRPIGEDVAVADAAGRVTISQVISPEPLPAQARSMMDGYAVRAADTFGASQSLPAYLQVAGEVPMGRPPGLTLARGQTALVHTGGMLPDGADAVVMLELTQAARASEIEVLKAVAPGENVLRAGEDIEVGAEVLPGGHWLRPQDVGALAALGITTVTVARQPRVAILATGDEVIPPEAHAGPGQVRDVNSFSVAGQVRQAGGLPLRRGIVPDDYDALLGAARAAWAEADALVISAGSSVSARDLTARVVEALGAPGVLVHGVAIKPGKPTLLAVAGDKPVIGLPGNPVSAMVIAELFVVPMVYRLQGCGRPPARPSIQARLTHNLPSQAGRVDYVPARLRYNSAAGNGAVPEAEPVFGKSNQILTLVFADGMIVVPMDATGLAAGELVEVRLF
jgi:molybdopterin molybdotransferase